MPSVAGDTTAASFRAVWMVRSCRKWRVTAVPFLGRGSRRSTGRAPTQRSTSSKPWSDDTTLTGTPGGSAWSCRMEKDGSFRPSACAQLPNLESPEARDCAGRSLVEPPLEGVRFLNSCHPFAPCSNALALSNSGQQAQAPHAGCAGAPCSGTTSGAARPSLLTHAYLQSMIELAVLRHAVRMSSRATRGPWWEKGVCLDAYQAAELHGEDEVRGVGLPAAHGDPHGPTARREPHRRRRKLPRV